MSERRCPDAAPCDVIIAEFVFGVTRCQRNAMYEVEREGEWWRVCNDHRRDLLGGGAS